MNSQIEFDNEPGKWIYNLTDATNQQPRNKLIN